MWILILTARFKASVSGYAGGGAGGGISVSSIEFESKKAAEHAGKEWLNVIDPDLPNYKKPKNAIKGVRGFFIVVPKK